MTKTVMIADDENSIVTLVLCVLEADERLRLLVARNGEEALEVARREKPDLIFLDVRMPKLDGFRVCEALKGDPVTAQVKVVMLTALAQENDRRMALDEGADDYMSKPFSIDELEAKVEEFLSLDPRSNEER